MASDEPAAIDTIAPVESALAGSSPDAPFDIASYVAQFAATPAPARERSRTALELVEMAAPDTIPKTDPVVAPAGGSALTMPCASCGAGAGVACMTAGGKPARNPHKARTRAWEEELAQAERVRARLRAVACPACAAPAGKVCRTPSGARASAPHGARAEAVRAKRQI
jgi:hypothetical protein